MHMLPGPGDKEVLRRKDTTMGQGRTASKGDQCRGRKSVIFSKPESQLIENWIPR